MVKIISVYLAVVSELIPWSSDVQKMADSVAQDGTAHTDCDGRGPIFGVPAVHVGVI
jgi:hypothetical protein